MGARDIAKTKDIKDLRHKLLSYESINFGMDFGVGNNIFLFCTEILNSATSH